MQASKIVAALVSVGIVGGTAAAVVAGGENRSPSAESLCSSTSLSLADQSDCKTQLKAAKTDAEKQQVATRFQGKIDARTSGAMGPAGSSASTSASGGTLTPSAPPSTTPGASANAGTSGTVNAPGASSTASPPISGTPSGTMSPSNPTNSGSATPQ